MRRSRSAIDREPGADPAVRSRACARRADRDGAVRRLTSSASQVLASPKSCCYRRASPERLLPGSSAVEQPAVNRLVDGSNPSPGSHFLVLAHCHRSPIRRGRRRVIEAKHGKPLRCGLLRLSGTARVRLRARGDNVRIAKTCKIIRVTNISIGDNSGSMTSAPSSPHPAGSRSASACTSTLIASSAGAAACSSMTSPPSRAAAWSIRPAMT